MTAMGSKKLSKTEQLICNSFVDLMEEVGFHNLSVKDIIEKCNIS